MKKIALLLLVGASVQLAMADQTTTCSNHGQERKIELIENEKGCQVNYIKGAESKILWSSARAAYCAPHAAEFIEKQKSWGYECTAQDATTQNSAQ